MWLDVRNTKKIFLNFFARPMSLKRTFLGQNFKKSLKIVEGLYLKSVFGF
jgi:hypothetical protein